MANTSTLSVYFLHLLLELRPTILVIIHLQDIPVDPPEMAELLATLLTQSQQLRPTEPAVILFSAEEDTLVAIDEDRLLKALTVQVHKSSRVLFVYLGADTSAVLGLSHDFNYRFECNIRQRRQLFLMPAAMWQDESVITWLLEINPAAHVATYEIRAGSVHNVREVCRGLNCQPVDPESIADRFAPQLDVRRMRFCKLTFQTTAAEVNRFESALHLLAALEWRWHLCFELEASLQVNGTDNPVSVEHKCGCTSGKLADAKAYPLCSLAQVSVRFFTYIERSNWVQLLTLDLAPWTWHRFSLFVPNWWHWRTASGSTQAVLEARTMQAMWTIVASLLCWLSLLAIRMLTTSRGQRGRLALEMWARMLAMAVSDSQSMDGLAMVASMLGMCNALALTGALFELRFGTRAEWQPVFRTLADVRQFGGGLNFYSPAEDFGHTMNQWLLAVGLSNERGRHPGLMSVLVLADGLADEMEKDVFGIHAANRSRVYRRISDPSLLFPVRAEIQPIWLHNQLRQFGNLLTEAGLTVHLFQLKDHRLNVREIVQWSPDESGTQPEDDDNGALRSLCQLYVGWFGGCVAIFVGETLLSMMNKPISA